ncbi:hypothetical protein GGR27_001951 [Lewinella antarctica]|uniref:Uncharacterized protein n=1 Tax=Neolewinella antarctica TaxID=442734 RepID=A0ABX0XB72_9BACT|nr:hypothetical protein [Neolewinella antarctica]
MAGRVADADENGFVFADGAGQGGVVPGVPVDGVVGVLEKVGAGFFAQVIDGRGLVLVAISLRGPS